MSTNNTFWWTNFGYWVVIVLSLGYLFTVDNWTRWVALGIAVLSDQFKSDNIRAWERYNISRKKKETKNNGEG